MSDKPRILVFPFDLLAHYLRTIQLAEILSEDYDVYFADSRKYTDHIKQAGFKTFKCAAFDSQEVMNYAQKFDFSWLNDEKIKSIFSDQVKVIRDLNPQVVLGDTAPTLKMAAEFTQTPYISLMNGYMSKYYAETRQLSATHPVAKYLDMLPVSIFERMTKLGEALAFRSVHRPFKKLRKHFDLSSKKMYLDELEGNFNLICDLPELFPQNNLPDDYVNIGPLFYRGQNPETELLKKIDNGKKNILVSVGSSGSLEKFNFLNQSYFHKYNIIVAGNEKGILQGPHILSQPFINMIAILDHVDLALLHGGNGSIYQALAFGVPVLARTSIFEQEWNVQALERLGLGKSLNGLAVETEITPLIEDWLTRKSSLKFKKQSEQVSIKNTQITFQNYFQYNIKPNL